MRIGNYFIVTQAAVSVVVCLEVSTLFIETIVVHHIVNQVVPEEQIRDGSLLVVDWVLSQVECEVEVEVCSTIWAKARNVVGITIFRRPYIVSAGDGKFSAWCSVGIVPAER